MILREAKRIVRERGPLVIAETRHGFICASAGVDHSNAPEPGTLVLLPVDPDAARAAVRAPDRTSWPASTSAWWSPIRSGGRSARGRRTLRSASPASRRSSTSRHDRPDRLRAPLEPGRDRRRDRRRRRPRPRQGRGCSGRRRPGPAARRRRNSAGDRDRARARSVLLSGVNGSLLSPRIAGIFNAKRTLTESLAVLRPHTGRPVPSRGHVGGGALAQSLAL